MVQSKTIEGTLFSSAFKTHEYVHVALNAYFDLVKSTKYQTIIGSIRTFYAAGKTAEADALKKKLPLFVCGGVMEGGRRLEHLKVYSSLLCADLDDVPGSPLSILQQAFSLGYVMGAHISPSGNGVKLFIPVDSDLAHHSLAFDTMRYRLEADLPGIQLDPSGKDPNRGCFVSYDPEAFLKEECEPLHVEIPAVASSGKRASAAGSGNALENYVDKFEADNPFQGGSRHTFVVKLAGALNSAGFAQGEVEAECVRRYALPDFTSDEIRKTVEDIYSRYRGDFGSRPFVGAGDPITLKSPKSPKVSADTISQASSSDGDGEEVDIELDATLLPHFKEEIYQHLPPLVQDILKPVTDSTEKDVTLFSALTLLSSTMVSVQGSFLKKFYKAPLYGLVLGASGSGKGCVSGLHRLIEPFQQYVYDNSHHDVKEYERKKEEYEIYKQISKQLKSKRKAYTGTIPEEPELVKQKNLHVSGYTSAARIIEQLQDNNPYISCLFETEVDAVTNTFSMDYGGYGYVVNKAAHHEMVGNASKQNGTFLVYDTQLAILMTGTPGMVKRLIPSAEDGLFSRMLIYLIRSGGKYRPLTSADDAPIAARYLDDVAQRVLDMAIFLEEHPTWVKFTDAQRKRIDRFIQPEYERVFIFGNEDMAPTVLRYRLAIFRLAMTLAGIRKGTSGNTDEVVTILDEDVDTATEMVRVFLRHAFMVGTMLKKEENEVHFKFPYGQLKLFVDMPDKFKRCELLAEALVRNISRSCVGRLLRKAEDCCLITSLGGGYFEKTEFGKDVKIPGVS